MQHHKQLWACCGMLMEFHSWELKSLPVFQGQFKLLVISYKALYGRRLVIWEASLFHYFCPPWKIRFSDMPKVPFIKQCHPMGPGNMPSPHRYLTLHPSKIQMAKILYMNPGNVVLSPSFGLRWDVVSSVRFLYLINKNAVLFLCLMWFCTIIQSHWESGWL